MLVELQASHTADYYIYELMSFQWNLDILHSQSHLKFKGDGVSLSLLQEWGAANSMLRMRLVYSGVSGTLWCSLRRCSRRICGTTVQRFGDEWMFLFSKGALHWSKARVRSMLLNISISNKCCSYEISIHQRILKKSSIKIWASNQHMIMISEGSCDTEEIQLWLQE